MSPEQDAQAAILGCLAWRVEQKREAQRAYRRDYYRRRKAQEAKEEAAGLAALLVSGYLLFKAFEPFLEAARGRASRPKPKTASAEAFDRLWRE